MQSALVTGASGFIGRALCARLAAGDVRVRALMRSRVPGPWQETVIVDLGAEDLPADALTGVDTVFHLAARVHSLGETQADEQEYRRVNVEGARRVLEAAVAAGARRFVLFSSVKAVGEGGERCIDETCDAAPETTYGRSKLEAERLVLQGGALHGLHVAILRLPLVYGPGHKGNLARMLRAVARGRFPALPEGGNRRSMVHVDDVAEAAVLAATRPEAAGKTYFVTDGEIYSTGRIHRAMCAALGRRTPRWAVPTGLLRAAAVLGDAIGGLRGRRFVFDSDALAKLTSSAWYDGGRIRRELGFRPARTLEQSLPDMIETSARERGA